MDNLLEKRTKTRIFFMNKEQINHFSWKLCPHFRPNLWTYTIISWFCLFGRIISQIKLGLVDFLLSCWSGVANIPSFPIVIIDFVPIFSWKWNKFLKKEQILFFKELKEHFWRQGVLYQTIKTKERPQHSCSCGGGLCSF